MPYIGNDLATQFQAFATQTITGDGSTGYTLDRAVANGKELLVYINNVKQEEGSGKAYTASGTTITFSEAVASTDSCYVVFLGSAVQTVVPPDGSLASYTGNASISGTLGVTGAVTASSGLDVTGAITASSASSINVTGGSALTLKSTDAGATAGPVLFLQRDSASPADSDICGRLMFRADNDAGQEHDFIKVESVLDDVSDGSENGSLRFFSSIDGTLAERMRLTSNGHLVVSNSSLDNTLSSTDSHEKVVIENDGDLRVQGAAKVIMTLNRNLNGGEIVSIRQGNTAVGGIDANSSSVDFNTSSDYRLKENVTTSWDATTRLKQLKPVRFSWKKESKSEADTDGFLAHEVTSVVPQATKGVKDEVVTQKGIDDGTYPKDAKVGDAFMQSIDHSKLVPLLVKTIQELEARIAVLESK
jgi:hypothetical protein